MSALLEAGCEHVSMSVYADVVAVSAASVAHVLDRAKVHPAHVQPTCMS